MTHAPFRSLRATTAICAVLALGSTPAWAQDTAAVPDAVVAPASPSAAPQPAAQQPTIQLPVQAPAPAAPSMDSSQITTAPAAETATPARAAAERRPAARTAAAPRSTAVQAAAVAAPLAAQPAVTPPVASNPPAASVPLAQPAVPAPAPETLPAARAASADWWMTPGAWVAALLLVFGAGAATYFAGRSRRRRDEIDEATYETVPAGAYAEPETQTLQPASAMAANEPTGGLEPEVPLPAFTTVGDFAAAPIQASMPEPAETGEVDAREAIGTEELMPATAHEASSAESFAMPAGPVPRGEARDALLKQMIDAAPDDQNPFRSRKARLRRARLILQSLEQKQKDEATQPFDWRTYQPSTRNPAPATPPRVPV
jgi:hypothetical protein